MLRALLNWARGARRPARSAMYAHRHYRESLSDAIDAQWCERNRFQDQRNAERAATLDERLAFWRRYREEIGYAP